jgi:ligand-binding sensor domain-containing protein
MIIKKISILLAVIISTGMLYAQTGPANTEIFNINDGLSQNAANDVIQDSKGYIWIATQDGLNKFDGYRFKVFRRHQNNKSSLTDNLIFSICADGDSAIWVATQRGLSRYSYKTDDFKSFFSDPADPYSLYTNSVRYVFTDSKGFLWIKSDEGLDRYNPHSKEFIFFKHPYDEFSFTSHYNNFSVVEDSFGNIWTGTKDGLAKFDRKAEQYVLYKAKGMQNSQENEVFSLLVNDRNEILVGTVSGLYVFDLKTKKFRKVFKSLSNETITAIFKDSNGHYWIGTFNGLYKAEALDKPAKDYSSVISDNIAGVSRITSITEDNSRVLWVAGENGIFKIDLKRKKFKLYRNTGNGSPNFSSNRFFSVYVLDDDRILLGTRKFGLNYFNRRTGKVKVFNVNNSGLADNNIHIIRKDNYGNILIGTENGIFVFDAEKSAVRPFKQAFSSQITARLRNNRIADILHDDKMRYWIATFNGLLMAENDTTDYFFRSSSGKNHIPGDEVLQIIQRKNGEIWAATNNGLARYDALRNSFDAFNEKSHGLSHFSVLSLLETRDSVLWAGTEYGLNRYLEQKDTFKVYSSENLGFANDFIYCILEDKNQNLWLSTNKGLIRFNPQKLSAVNYHYEDGLQSYEFNIGAAYKKEDGEMFFGGVEGLNAFYPDSVRVNQYAPPAIFTEIEILSPEGPKTKPLNTSDYIKLNFNERTFTVYFTMPEYTHISMNSYKCKIEGFNNEWQDIGTHNFYTVTQIPPGKYRLLVKAYNSDGVEAPKVAALTIDIPAPWWMTVWAYITYAVIIVALLVWIFLRYNRHIRRENRILIEKQKTAKKIERQKELLSIKNKNISDSILYAKRIIDAMMPSDRYLKRLLPDSFVFFMPKDIVSGDFYWTDYKDGIVYVAIVDCTGHGVPGAFMSIVGLNLLRDILSLGVQNPAVILDRMSKEVREIFSTEEDAKQVRDGMDMTICAIDRKNKRLEFAGAKNPLYLIRNDRILEYKGDRFSVGPGSDDGQKFENYIIELEKDDIIYMFSDGYADQFGGPKNKKFKYRRFRSVLLDIYKKNTAMQQNELKDIITRWKNGNEQVDDMLIMGIRPLEGP